eukprot:4136185-Prymnesium_polylepis.2
MAAWTHAPINLFGRRKRGVRRCEPFTVAVSRPPLLSTDSSLFQSLRGAAPIIHVPMARGG